MLTSKSKNKIIGITIGDPSGIGPEIVAKALRHPSLKRINLRIIGETKKYPLGQVNNHSGQASLKFLDQAVELLKTKEITALVTAPVCKEAICLTDPTFHGHTEFLAKAFHCPHVDMMFVAEKLRTVIVTRHLPLKNVSKALTKKSILQSITLTHQALKDYFKIKNPQIAVCGLNPHAGEGGTIGDEEMKIIIPAIQQAKKKKMNIIGPLAADTLFSPKIKHSYDAVIAMYHDQGLIPIKTLYYPNLVNLTLGLPFIRTSPAHGTAFDIAGKNKADPTSMIEAIKLAYQLLS